MINNLFRGLLLASLFFNFNFTFAQAPPLGTAANFVLFSSTGALSNTGISQLTGNVGTDNGAISGFGNVNGQMHNADGATAQCAADLLTAYNILNSTVANFFPAPLLGNGQVFIEGVYSIAAAATLNLDLILDAQGNTNAVFIIMIGGPLSTNANSKVKLINGALACNVYWKVEGLVSMAPGTSMKGTVIANNAAIVMNGNDTLEGRALSTTGAITIDGTMAYTPVGCGSAILTGPAAPDLLSTACYTLFTSNGSLSNSGVTNVTGDVGTNVGLTTGFNPLFVDGAVHPIPDGSTAAAASDLITVYDYLNLLPYDIELLYPAQFGQNLVLTPHTYLLNAATTFTDTLYLNAMGDTNAVFVFQINGALSTSTFANVVLTNGTKAKNVFWKIDGAVGINDYTMMVGTLVANNGAISLNTGVQLNGRALTTTGAFTTAAITAIATAGCSTVSPPIIISQPQDQIACAGDTVNFSVSASGTGLSYQWRMGTVNLMDGGQISGATTANLSINNVDANNASTMYNVVVMGADSAMVISNNVALMVNAMAAMPGSISGPASVCGFSTQTYSILAVNGATSYTWIVPSGITILSGQNSTMITISANNTFTSGNISVTANNDCGMSMPSTIMVANCIPLTQLRAVDCGKLNLVPNAQISANVVSGASNYEWEFSDIVTNQVYANRITTPAIITPGMVTPALQWNTQYNLRVRAKVGGQWGAYGAICVLGLMQNPAVTGIAATSIRPQFCNVYNLSLNSVIASQAVTMSSLYQYEFTDVSTNQVSIKQLSSVYLILNTVAPALMPGHIYNVRVRGFVFNTWSAWSAVCNLGISNGVNAREFSVQIDDEGNETFIEKEVIVADFIELNVFPNPIQSEGGFTIKSNVDKIVLVNLYDALGRVVFSKQFNTNQYHQLPAGDLEGGIYMLSVTKEDGTSNNMRLIKTK